MRLIVAAAAMLAFASSADAQDRSVKIGVLTDMSGVLSSWAGPGSVVAAQLAVEDYKKAGGTYNVEIISADHQNKPDIGSTIARRWISAEGVNAVVDVPNSGVALAVNEILRNTNAAYLASSSTNVDLTGKACSPNTVNWTTDSYGLSNTLAKSLVGSGQTKWFFLTADFAGGYGLEQGAIDALAAANGQVLGRTRFPFDTSDFASFILQAQASRAQIIGMAVGGTPMHNLVKQASEFGLSAGGQKLAALALFITDVHAIGLKTAQGLQFAAAFYWDLNDGTREFARRFTAKFPASYPTQFHAGVYATTLHYLKAVEARKTLDGKTLTEGMKQMPTEDIAFGKGSIRADGRVVHDHFLFEVKTPAESTRPWDYYKLVKRLSGEEAFRSLEQGGCPLVGKAG